MGALWGSERAPGTEHYVKGDEFESRIFPAELGHIAGLRGEKPDGIKGRLFGLAFSGGGIRSATFALGMSQSLAEKGWLQRFHYLSTVSGGGYIGSSLTWMWHKLWTSGGDGDGQVDFDAGHDFPYRKYHGTSKGEAEYRRPRALLRHLRQHGKYLTPGGGIDGASLLAVILRGTLLSLLVYLVPLLLVFYLLSANVNQADSKLFSWVPWFDSWFDVLTAMGIATAVLFAGIAVAYGLFTVWRLGSARAYHWRRCFEIVGGFLLKLSAVLLIVGTIQNVVHWLPYASKYMATAMSSGGLLGAVFSVFRVNSGKAGGRLMKVVAPIALALLVYGLLLGAYWVATYLHGLHRTGDGIGECVLVLVVSVLLGSLCNINYISIHRYYRDRLMELFMPDVDKLLQSPVDRKEDVASEANGAGIHEMCRHGPTPYHIINAKMVTLGSRRAKLRARGGENFMLSPLYCGSEATGWLPSDTWMDGRMKLATAMAISGAAADPNGAPGGEGILRNPALALLMALLNIRLGYWAPNPGHRNGHKPMKPNWYMQGFREAFGVGMNEEAKFVHLSDGGHFENLALYELVRRRVKLIIVCDAAADGGYTFADFANFVEKVRVDFAADVTMRSSFLTMCPKPYLDAKGNPENPFSVDLAEKGYVTGAIQYDDGSEGTLVYVKTTLIPHLPKDIYGYQSAHPDFPDESTADQFFDEKQFEAYRELGYRIGRTLWEDEEVSAHFA